VENSAFVPFVVSMEEMHYGSFDNRKKTLEEIKYLFFNTLYLWTAAFVSPFVISYHNFFSPY
jgi:hypothetical protein